MSTFTIETSVENPEKSDLKVYLKRGDNKIQTLIDNDSISCFVKEGARYHVEWHVWGETGLKYSVKITSPEDAKFEHEWQIPTEQEDFGGFYFTA